MASGDRRLLAREGSIFAVSQDYGDENVVITFGHALQAPAELRFWGDEFLAKERISAIGIVSGKADWYPAQYMRSILPLVTHALRSRRPVTYGFSQGGYAALKFSAALRARAVLAFNAQWSIDPFDVGDFDTDFTRYFSGVENTGSRIDPQDLHGTPFCIFDPKEYTDAIHALRLQLKGVNAVWAPYTWHGSIHLAVEAGLALPLIRACFSDPPPAKPQIRKILRRNRCASPTYLRILRCALIRRLLSRRTSRSALFCQGINSLCTGHRELVGCLLGVLCRGDLESRQEFRRRIGCDEYHHMEDLDVLSIIEVCRMAQLPDLEVKVAAYLRKAYPEFTCGRLRAVVTLLHSEPLSTARIEFHSILNNNPDSIRYTDLAATVAALLGYAPDLVAALHGMRREEERKRVTELLKNAANS